MDRRCFSLVLLNVFLSVYRFGTGIISSIRGSAAGKNFRLVQDSFSLNVVAELSQWLLFCFSEDFLVRTLVEPSSFPLRPLVRLPHRRSKQNLDILCRETPRIQLTYKPHPTNILSSIPENKLAIFSVTSRTLWQICRQSSRDVSSKLQG